MPAIWAAFQPVACPLRYNSIACSRFFALMLCSKISRISFDLSFPSLVASSLSSLKIFRGSLKLIVSDKIIVLRNMSNVLYKLYQRVRQTRIIIMVYCYEIAYGEGEKSYYSIFEFDSKPESSMFRQANPRSDHQGK